MDRREFIKSATSTIAIGATTHAFAEAPPADKTTQPVEKSDVVVVRNGEPVAMFRKGIDALGGMKAFVKPGQKVVVKPNAAWDKTPEEAANTSPELVAEIVRQAIAAGASEVIVFDNTCNNWRKSYETSGIEKAVTEAGAKMLPANLESHYVARECPKAKVMKKALIHKALIAADVVINVPILKNHGGAKMTSAMKNWMGVIWDRRYMHSNNLPQCIADLILYRKPDLNVVDAYRIMTANGPRGVSKADLMTPKYMILGTDPVAVDALSTKLMKYKLAEVPYLGIATEMGIGQSADDKINIMRLEV